MGQTAVRTADCEAVPGDQSLVETTKDLRFLG